MKICVIVKKRPIFQKEMENGEIDVVAVSNPMLTVHECKYKVDGITKFIENQTFQFDNAYSCTESTEELYEHSLRPILDNVFNTGTLTIFAYG